MKKILGMIALLATSAAVVATPALANDRDNYNHRDVRAPIRTTVVVRDRHDRDRDHDRRVVEYRNYDRR